MPLEVFLEALAISRATFKRDMEYLRDRLNAPIIWNRGRDTLDTRTVSPQRLVHYRDNWYR